MRSDLLTPAWRVTVRACLLLSCALAVSEVQAQEALLNEVHTIASTDTGVPFEHEFAISTAGTYEVVVTDLGTLLPTPAPLDSIKTGVTLGTALIGDAFSGAGTFQFTATAPGTYSVRVIGKAGAGAGSGAFGVSVAKASDHVQVATFSASLAPPVPEQPTNRRVLDASFQVSAAGDYDVKLADLAFPQALQTLTLIVIQEGESAPVVTLPENSGGTPRYTKTVHLNTGANYRILAVGEADTAASAGLYSASVRATGSGAGEPLFVRTLAVGSVKELASGALSAGNYSFDVTDLATPAALSQVSAALVFDGEQVVRRDSAGSSALTVTAPAATAGAYRAYALATPDATPGTGSYAVTVRLQGGAAVFGSAQAVSLSGSPISTYTFDVPVSASGAMRARLTDFFFPLVLTNLSMVAVQNATVLGTPLTAAGSLDLNAVNGTVSFLVFAQAQSSGGLFGLDLTPNGASGPSYETTQGVGALFVSRKVSVGAAGNYDLTVTDVKFPSQFGNFSVVATRGVERVLTVLGAGKKDFAATPGNYFINFIAEPDAMDKAGTYSLNVSPSQAPIVSLTSDVTRIASGSSVTLTWTSDRATACTASDGWSGTKQLNGSERSSTLTANTTFTLTCTGPGGSTSKSLTVNVDPAAAASGGGGGGGRLDLTLLLALALLLSARQRTIARVH